MFKSKTFLPHHKTLASAEWPIRLTPFCFIIFSKETIQFGPQNTIKFCISSHSLVAYFLHLSTLQKAKTPNRTANESKAGLILLIPFHIKLLIHLILSFISLPFIWNIPCPTQSADSILHVSLSAVFSAGRMRIQT